MTLSELLRVKGCLVHRISANASLGDAVDALVRNNCGSLVVCEENDATRLVGIITERDLLRASARRASLDRTKVAEVMTREVITGRCDDSIEDTMGLMTERRVRHLPIVENGQLAGIISIGDIVKWQHKTLSAENHYLKEYIQI